MTGMEFSKLERPSELLRVAIADARKLDRSIYHPDSGSYYYPVHVKKCYVCDAGAVMVNTLRERGFDCRVPLNYPRNICERLRAIDALRLGNLYTACIYLYGTDFDKTRVAEIHKKIDAPGIRHFIGWEEMDDHLEALEEYADALETEGY